MGLLVFGLGTIFGSFLGVIIDRLPSGRNIATGRSQCDACQTILTPLDLIPILSYLKTKGHCSHCHAPLSVRYLILEVLTGVAYLLVYLSIGFHFELILGLTFVSFLIVITFIDIDTMLIFDRFHFLIATIGIIGMIMNPETIPTRLLGLVIVSIPYLLLALLTQGIGGGDVKLMAAARLVLGAPNTVLAFVISTLIGGVYGIYVLISKKHGAKDPIPFGPFLCIGIFTAYLYGPAIINWYISLF